MTVECDWSTLTHAYGTASDVPDLLDRLASEDADERLRAFDEFYGSLCHQGSVYPATLAAVPRLIAIATTPGYPDKRSLFEAMGAIARGHGAPVDGAAIRTGIAPFATALLATADDEATKLTALGIFRGEELAGTADALAHLARSDASALVRMTAWAAIGYVAPGALPAAVDDDNPDVALAVDLANARLGRTTREAEARLEHALVDATIAERLEHWTERAALPSPCAHVARHLEKDGSPFLGITIARLAASVDMMAATALIELLLDALVPRQRESKVDLATISEGQRRVLVAIAEYDAHWDDGEALNGNLLSALMNHGLPSGLDAREALCGALGVTPKKRAIIVLPRQIPAAAAIATELGRDAWVDVPFVFTANAGGALQEAIPEDPADFPEDVMDDFGQIAAAMWELSIRHTGYLETGAFYPKHTPRELEAIVRELGFEVLAPNLAHANDPYEPSEDEDDDD